MKIFSSRPTFRTLSFPSLGRVFFLVLVLVGCASTPPDPSPEPVVPTPEFLVDLEESPTGEGAWRPHRLSSCAADPEVPTAVEGYLGICSESFRDG